MLLKTNSRLDYLDAVRAFALLLGIIFHASLSFIPIFIGWAVMDISTSNIVSAFVLVSHSFRMELFFLIAGFFGHMKFHQQGLSDFFKSRLLRIGIPFVVGWFLFRPLLISGWIIGGESMQGDVNIWPALSNSFVSFATNPKEFFIGTHLWFLYYLILISASVVLLRNIIEVNESVKKYLLTITERVITWFCHSPVNILIAAIPTAYCLWFMDNWGMDTPDKSLIPHIPVLLIYGGFFLLGWLMHRQSALIAYFSQLSLGKFVLCILSIALCLILSKFEINVGHEYYLLLKAGFKLSYAITMWSLVSVTLGICKFLFSEPNKYVRYVADSAYWLYLIHLPIVVWLQVAFAELPLHWSIKWFGICTMTIVLSIALYDAFVRSTSIGAILNGKKQTRVLFK
ncbi:MAG: acyltransferase family protein [Thalassotalea sp.]